MEVVTTRKELAATLTRLRNGDKSLALVPTMGCLHQGHLSLLKQARLNAQLTAASIFVNPSQFNNKEDLERYPRTLEKDLAMLESVGTQLVFAPKSAEEIYPPGFQSWITNEQLSLRWEGASRPGHFRGVVTVVSILFSLFRPTLAVFGEKDFQQLRIVEQLVDDLHPGLKILRGPTLREPDGLAMSSRNVRLSAQGRTAALSINRALRIARDAYMGRQRSADFLLRLAKDALGAELGVSTDYVALIDEKTLEPLQGEVTQGRMLIAASVEGVRLIDNMAIGPDSAV